MTDSDTPDTNRTASDVEESIDSLPPSNVLDDSEPRVTVPLPPCDACESNYPGARHTATIDDTEYKLCEGCRDHLTNEVEAYNWWDRLTEDHYNRAAEYLRSLDAVWCVKDNAAIAGEMWVHTPYLDYSVVADVCDHFGFRVRWFTILHPGDDTCDCVDEHGPCVEINLDYNHHVKEPFPLEYDLLDDVNHHDIDYLDEDNRLFDEPK
jgi:hypothetical protein